MKILFVCEHFPPHIGGVEIVFEEYAKRLAKKGHEIKIITSNSGRIVGIKKIDGYYVEYVDCKSFFGHPIIPDKVVEKHVAWADIIHTTTYTAALPALKCAKKFNKPCILMAHEVLGKRWFRVEKNPFKALGFLFFERYVVKKDYTLWQAISKSTEIDLLEYGIPKEKIRMIYHGIDYSVWNPGVEKRNLNKLLCLSDKEKIFLYNGRPGQTKGVFLLLEAIRKIKDAILPDFKFGFILSQKPEKERSKFEELVKEYALEDIVKFIDSLPYAELPGYRKNAFAIITPSLTEGFGFATAETCALGIPVISSDAGSLPEVASGKVLFFKSGNTDDLAEKIILATKNGFENIPEKRFDWDNAIDEAEKMYKEIL